MKKIYKETHRPICRVAAQLKIFKFLQTSTELVRGRGGGARARPRPEPGQAGRTAPHKPSVQPPTQTVYQVRNPKTNILC